MQRRRSVSKKEMSGSFLPYEVVYCTSEDPHHPIREMAGCTAESMKQEDAAKGWQSAANGKIPQTIVLRFPGNVFLQQIKLLSHEAKVATKVEVRVFALKDDAVDNPPSYRAARFTKLGAVEFNSNEHTGFKSKERKTVHLQAEAYYLKLLFDRPYVNDLNMKQQVGLYSIECSGRLLTPAAAPPPHTAAASSSHTSPAHSQLPSARGVRLQEEPRTQSSPVGASKPRPGASSAAAAAKRPQGEERPEAWHSAHTAPTAPLPGAYSAEEPFYASQDSVFRSIRIQQFEEFFIHRTEELLLLKEQAITVEDFETARACRDKLNSMNLHSKRIYQLEQEKVQAIIEEDFETAEVARDAMNELVDTVYRDTQLPIPKPDFDADGAYQRAVAPGRRVEAGTAAAPAVSRYLDEVPSERDVVRTSNVESSYAIAAAGPSVTPSMHMDTLENGETDATPDRGGEITATTNVDDEILPRLERATAVPTSSLLGKERDLAETILALAAESSDAVTPVPMSGADARLVSSIGSFTAMCLFSTKFKLREAALVALTERLDTYFPDSIAQAEEAVLRFLDVNGYGLQDNITNVVVAGCTFVRMALADQHDVISAVVPQLLALLPRLLTRAADAQARVRDEAVTTLTLFVRTAAMPSSALLAAALVDPIDRERRTLPASNAKAQIARLAFTQTIVEEGRFAVENPRAIMGKLLIPGLNHQNAEVRDLATGLLSSLILSKSLIPTEAELKKISNPAIRDLLHGRRQSVV